VRAVSAATSAKDRAGRPFCDLPQQGRGLVGSEPKLGGAQLGELTAGPQPPQRQRRVGPARQHHLQPRRQMLQQEQQRLVHRLSVEQVVVVQNQDRLFLYGLGGQFVDQRRRQACER